MTDKQIIIDRVNVAGCVRLQDDEISCDLGGECKGWENCYYKQLKRKEQENERLKSELQAKELELIMAKADLCRGCQYKNDYKAKEQECEELKKELMKKDEVNTFFNTPTEGWSNDPCEICPHKAENEKLKNTITNLENIRDKFSAKLDQLKAELQEYQDWFDEFKLMFRYDDREPDDNSELYSCLESVVDENKKLKQTEQKLEKIRQVCAETKDVGENIKDMYTAKLSGLYLKSRQILQIIDEVEE